MCFLWVTQKLTKKLIIGTSVFGNKSTTCYIMKQDEIGWMGYEVASRPCLGHGPFMVWVGWVPIKLRYLVCFNAQRNLLEIFK